MGGEGSLDRTWCVSGAPAREGPTQPIAQTNNMLKRLTFVPILLALVLPACQGEPDHPAQPTAPASAIESGLNTAPPPSTPSPMAEENVPAEPNLEIATLGAGCYWCVEAVYDQLPGVRAVSSGFMGGPDDNATYEQVCTGTTGHAEVVQVTFDPAVLPYDELLDWFWRLHDPTTLNRQGADVGTQYRSVIFFHSPEQERVARLSKSTLGERGDYSDPVVTEISAASTMIPGPAYHQDYYRDNKRAGYCQMVIAPKLRKLGLED